jgi:hypothetical protein
MAIESVGLIEPVLQFEDGNGIPYAGGSVTFVIVGTSTSQNVYSDPALTVSLGNIVTLNAAAGLVAFDLIDRPDAVETPLVERLAAKLSVARETIDSGAASAKLHAWVAATNA